MVMKDLGMLVEKNLFEVFKKLDKVRVQHAERAMQEIHKKVWESRIASKRKLEELYELEEDPDNPSYSSGHY